MYVNFYKFNKKIKSTKRPTSYSFRANCNILFPCDILNPTIQLTGYNNDDNFSNVNYCFIPEFNRYYWISGKKILNNTMQEITLSPDTLANFKNTIGNYAGFITRCSNSNYYNDMAHDNMVSPTYTVRDQIEVSQTYQTGFSRTQGTYLINTYGKGSDYVLSRDSLVNIMNDLLDTNTIWDEVEAGKFNPGSYIRKIMYLPYRDNGTYPGDIQVDLGFVERTIGTNEANSRYIYLDSTDRIYTNNINIPVSDITSHLNYSDFRRYDNNFTKISLKIPFVGVIELPNNALQYTTIGVRYVIDSITGTGYCGLTAVDSDKGNLQIGKYNITVGIDVPISTYTKSTYDLFNNILGSVSAGGMTKETGIAGVDNLLYPYGNFNCVGSSDGVADLYSNSISIYIDQLGSTGIPINIKGRPALKSLSANNLKISSIPGYIETLNCNIENITGGDPNPTENELRELCQLMDTGFYYE